MPGLAPAAINGNVINRAGALTPISGHPLSADDEADGDPE
jgi:hypothetical protein